MKKNAGTKRVVRWLILAHFSISTCVDKVIEVFSRTCGSRSSWHSPCTLKSVEGPIAQEERHGQDGHFGCSGSSRADNNDCLIARVSNWCEGRRRRCGRSGVKKRGSNAE